MGDNAHRAIAIVGLGAVLPDAPDVKTFWDNVITGRYSISEVTPDRWDPALYYDADPKAPDKAYSTIGGWVRDFDWDPLGWKLPIPPKISAAMDRTQKWAIIGTREALADYGYPQRPLDPDRTAVILGNAMGGDLHYLTALRLFFPEYAAELTASPTFAGLPADVRDGIVTELRAGIGGRFPEVTEDTMPGELANIIAGRVANLFDLHGPNFITDAACASAMAAVDAAIEGLEQGGYDAVVTGGIDANMSASTFIKFCKIGALSATGTRPYADGADGFVMGEGGAVFLLKRLADAERDGDEIYAVIRGMGGASDGRGKGITAPNPVGQLLAVQRAWDNAGIRPDASTLVEGHGTSTRVGDVVEVESLSKAFSGFGLAPGTVPLGSVKSNIGHLKGAAGAAGMLKAALALHHKTLPPSLNFARPNPNIDFATSPFYVNTEVRPWDAGPSGVRTAAVSAFGFGGTNFHAVLEEYVPGRLQSPPQPATATVAAPAPQRKAPLRGALVVGGPDTAAIRARLQEVHAAAAAGRAPAPAAPAAADLGAPVRVAIDYDSAETLADRTAKAIEAIDSGNPAAWKLLRARGVFLGRGPAPKVAFLYTGQGSQYVNMLQELRDVEPIVAETFAEADRVMTPLLGKPLSDYIFVDGGDRDAVKQADEDLRQTAITQPAVLATDAAMTRLMAAYGVGPDMVMGHSLGEYGALTAADALPLPDALEAVSARGREMTKVSVDDNGKMLAVFGPLEEIQRIIAGIDGYVEVANINSNNQAVVGGASPAVTAAAAAFKEAGFTAIPIPVSHAFHTNIVAPASEPLMRVLERLDVRPPAIPIVANVSGDLYPAGPDIVPEMIDILGKQISSPVQFVKGLQTLYDQGARLFVEMGPKKALHGFVEDVLGDNDDVVALFTNHPKVGDVASFNQALCGLYAAGLGVGTAPEAPPVPAAPPVSTPATAAPLPAATTPAPAGPVPRAGVAPVGTGNGDVFRELGHLFAEFLDRGMQVYAGRQSGGSGGGGLPSDAGEPVVVTGAAIGLPGGERVFDDANVSRILHGEQFIDTVPVRFRQAMVDKNVTRLVKSEAGGGRFEVIDNIGEVIKLAARGGALDLVGEFGFPEGMIDALDTVTELAIGAGIDALRDAGLPLVMRYKTTTRGTQLPDRWMLPEALRDDTGVVFASAFPGADSLVDEVSRFHEHHARVRLLQELRTLRQRSGSDDRVAAELDRRIHDVEAELAQHPYTLDRKFLFRALSMGHSQFAQYIGARGPNTQLNAACASTTQAVAVAEDWIRAGRCRRVVIVSADDVTSDHLIEWVGAGFLASGAAATDEVVEEAAIPFDRRRHGLILGMGGAAIVVESAAAARERGLRPIAEVLSTVTANSAFHGTRLDVDHIRYVVEELVSMAERRWGIDRQTMAPETVFVSHETYTPARGGSAQAEVDALRFVFGAAADQLVIANTKGFTGHPMGVGIEDVVALKALETGIVPPVANFKEVDPDLGRLNLSRGGAYPVRYALRLGAGFGSQISLSLMRWVPTPSGARTAPDRLGYAGRIEDDAAWRRWLTAVTGDPDPALEVTRRTLRVTDRAAPPAAAPVPAQAPPVPQPVAAAPVAPEPAPVPAEPAANADPLAERVLAVVSAQTGYPPEMLDLDLDLEADLGIDTVKQAETFAAIREEYGIERDDALALRDYPTLAAVIGFVRERRPDLAPAPVAEAPSAPAPAAGPAAVAADPVAADPVSARVLAVVSAQTGYPPEMLDLDLDLEADLGIDTVKQAETFAAIREEYGIERDDALALRDYPTLAAVIGFVRERRPDLAPAPVAAAPSAPAPAAGPAAVAADPVAADPVSARVLAVVSAQTGYPPEMLDLDLDLEADLGIDTVKQAETFAAIREEYGIERDDALALRDYPTLAAVIGFVRERRPDLAPAPVAAAPSAPAPAAGPAAVAADPVAADPVSARVLAVVSAQTGYPPEMLDLDLDLEADLGIDTVKQAETFAAIREEYGIERDDALALRDYPTLAAVIGFVRERRPDLAPAPVAAAPSAPAPAAGPAAVAADPVAADPVSARVLAVVSAQTGYPPEMLDLDLDLEADLGIDTVKQAETFAAIREEYGIERDDALALRDYPTLAAVIGFVREHRPDLAPTAGAATPAEVTAEATAPPTSGLMAGDDEAAAAIERRVVVPVLRPPVDRFVATGATLTEGSRVVVMHDAGGVGKALTSRLQKRGVSVLEVDGAPETAELEARIAGWAGDGPVHGVYWLPALDDAGDVPDLAAWREALRLRVKLLYTTMRALYDHVTGPGTFLVAATRLGGRHGYDAAGAVDPLGGPVVGFAKTYKREKPEATVKAVDFAPSRKTAAIADRLIDETVHDPGVVEVGYAAGHRWSVSFDVKPLPEDAAFPLGEDGVFVVTGAAGSITSAITADLAAASGGTFYLLDLVPEPDPADPDIARFAEDRDGLKVEIFERLKAAGERATPAMVERELSRLERAHAALEAIRAVERAGGTARYHSADLRDPAAVAAAIADVREHSGRIDALLHAGGIEISRFLPDKAPEEFDLVFDIKADGWFNLLHAIGDMPLGATVGFSSVAGRFGNGGQADYSSANDLLCKAASAFRTTRPDTRGITIDWTAWGGIGMATRGSIPTMMKAAGIDMLPAEAGIPIIRRELTAGTRDELVIGKALGILTEPWHPGGGLDSSGSTAGGPMAARATAFDLYRGLVVETTLDPTVQPFLDDHRIDGTAVLPGVMGIEAFVEAAAMAFPGLAPVAVEDVEFLAPFKFYRDEGRTVTVEIGFTLDGDEVVGRGVLSGSRMLPGHDAPQRTDHFRAAVRLGAARPEPGTAKAVGTPKGATVGRDAIYALYFHGPAYQVMHEAWRRGDTVIGRMAADLPPNQIPDEPTAVFAPRLIELCFQTAGIWEMGTSARMGLPARISRVTVGDGDGTAPFHAVVTPDDAGGFAAVVVDKAGRTLVVMDGYGTAAVPAPLDDDLVEPLRRAMTES